MTALDRQPFKGSGVRARALVAIPAVGLAVLAGLLCSGAATSKAPALPFGGRVLRLAAGMEASQSARIGSQCYEASETSYAGCIDVYTGTFRSVWSVYNPHGVEAPDDMQVANYRQRTIYRSSDTVHVETLSVRVLDTRVKYPLDPAAVSQEARRYLAPEQAIQADDPDIVAKTMELISGAARQSDVVQRIMHWMPANIEYDSTLSLPCDATSVFRNRSGICQGYSNLSVAMLRAAGIPSRVVVGCVGWHNSWGLPTPGEGHAWIEIYYPDVGWAASDPTWGTMDFVETSHLYGYGELLCGSPDTEIVRLEPDGDVYELTDWLHDFRPPRYTETDGWGILLDSAYLPQWDRYPLFMEPREPSIMLSTDEPVGSFKVTVGNLSCKSSDWNNDWQLVADADWLSPQPTQGDWVEEALLQVDARGLMPGRYEANVVVSVPSLPPDWPLLRPRSYRVALIVADTIHTLYIPAVRS